MNIIVAGAGIIGVTTAWFLSGRGHRVTVLERQADVAMETSYANGGQVSMSGAEPWANPGAPLQALKWLGQEDAPLLLRLRADPRMWSWTLAFLSQCTPGRTRRNTLQILTLAMYSRTVLAQLRRQTGIEFDARDAGILHFYTDEKAFRQARDFARIMIEHGLRRNVLDVDQTVALEPAMASCRDQLAGAIHTPDDGSGDARKFTVALRDLARQQAVEFLHGIHVDELVTDGDRVQGLTVHDEQGVPDTLHADAYVIALGSYSPLLLQPAGIRVPVYPVKGYSATVDTRGFHGAPTISLTDETHKLVFSRLGDRLRIAGTAELAGYDTHINERRCQALIARARALWPDAGEYDTAEFWAGLRPATPGNVPLVGHTRLSNLYLNTGHGTLGWTLSCGSAQALADIIDGVSPEIEFEFL